MPTTQQVDTVFDVKREALSQAVRMSTPEHDPETVVKRASAFYDFLAEGAVPASK